MYLVCRAGTRLCAIPIDRVFETMRPLPLGPLPDTPEFVLGVSVIRGRPTPVLSAAKFLRDPTARPPSRLVTLRVGDRQVAMAVDETLGVRAIPGTALAAAPPITGQAESGAVAAIGTLDRELLVVLETGRLIPDGVWASIEEQNA